MKTNIFVRAFSAIFILTFALLINVSAQSDGRIAGSVTDANGGVVAGSTVTVTNEQTGEARTVTANDDGSFLVVGLKPSKYTVAASGGNFDASSQKGIELLVGQELNLTMILQAKGVSAQVDVVAGEDSIVNTSSAGLSANVNPREVEGLPINGRQLSQLYLQAPGALNSGQGTFSDIRFSGRANNQNVIRYDGVEGTAVIDSSPGNLNGEIPSPFRLQSSLENVQEFRVDSSNFPAEYGTGTGGQISVVTKSGGNEFHGSVFEYLRRTQLDARNFFDNVSPGIAKSPLRLDQFGGSVGGPIIKNKLFFFGSYERYVGRYGLNIVEAAPITNTATLCAPPVGTGTFNCQIGGVNSPNLAFLSAFRSPNAVIIPGGTTVAGFDILQLSANQRTDEKAYAARFDYQYNDLNKIYGRFFRDEGTDITPEGVSGRVVSIEAVPQNGVFGWQSILRTDGTLLNDFKFGYNGARTRINGSAPTVGGLNFSNIILNISGSVANTGIAGQGTSSGISIPGGLVRANSATNGRGQPYTPFSLGFIDSINWIKGNHNFKFGGEIRLIRLYTDRLGGTTYTFTSLQNFLTNTLSSVQYLGDVSAVPSPFTAGPGGDRLAEQEYFIGYGQDEWKIAPGLTLSYGLRYEYYTRLREKNNQQVLFNIDNGTLRLPTEQPFLSSKTNFGPRVAITWSPNQSGNGMFAGGKTVLRAGFGIYYGPGQTEDQIQPIESDRISSTISSGALLAFPANIPGIVSAFNSTPANRTYQPRAYSNNYKIPEKIYSYTFSWQQQLPGGITSTVAYVGSQGRNLFLRSVANRILPGQTSIVNGSALPTGVGVVNRTDPITGQVIGVTSIRQFDILNAAAIAAAPSGCGASASNAICRPFAEVDYKTSGGDDRYNALQVSVQKSSNIGLTMNAQYTYAKSQGTSAGSNEARTSGQLENFEADRGRNNFDVRHTFNLSALYQLPIGTGKMWDFGKTGNMLLGGWEIGGIANARSGVPVEVLITRPDVVVQCTLAAGCPNGSGGFFANGFVAQLPSFSATFPALPTGFIAVVNTPGGGASRSNRRPDLIAGVNPYLKSDRNFINPAAFATPAAGVYGNLSRNLLSGPIFRQIDLTVAKRFQFTETTNFEFRTEFFNVLNQTNFANPSVGLSLALPGLSCVVVAGACTTYSATGTNLQPGQAYTQSAAGSTFGLLRSTVGRTVGLGSNRQIQFVFRFKF
ncbi:MAG: carboxypeptidase regulatory-like domain-containing protein [Pyrinomonadaceae bacterium]